MNIDSTEQVIEIHPPQGNVFTVQTIAGNIVQDHQIQTIDGSTMHTVDGNTVQTVGGNTIVQTVDNVGAVQTIDGATEHMVEVSAQGTEGGSVAIHVEDGSTETDDSVQFCIVATPEMLEAFGLQDERK